MIYFDYISSIKIYKDTARFTGGGNYVKTLLKKIKADAVGADQVVVLLPEGTAAPDREYEDLFSAFHREYADSLLSCKYEDGATLFLPQVNGHTLRDAYRIKKSFPSLKIYGTLHDRQHNYEHMDLYDFYYKSGWLERVGYACGFVGKRLYFNLFYDKWIAAFDKVFTVSNYSLQKLRSGKINSIGWYFQPSSFRALEKDRVAPDVQERFALFVGGNRPEKNLLRTIEAFCGFAGETKGLALYVTGVDDKLIERFAKKRKLDRRVIEERIRIFGYLPDEELNLLYARCRFVIFTSKGEGFGLPVLEALSHNKAVLASWATSIPEVGGSAVRYVNPYSVKSIADGIRYMNEDNHLELYTRMAERKRHILEQNMEMDIRALLHEIFS